MSAQLHKTRVDLDGLMKVLGEHLYSTPTVAVRELVQNAHDSCERRRIEDEQPEAPAIRVLADPAARTLAIEDSGAGLTAEEIERYLATVGSGYTRTLRERGDQPSLIGYFGLGFLSAFVVAERAEVWTCSYREADRAWRFVSHDGQRYSLEPGPSRAVGTRVTLRLRERHGELANPVAVRRLLTRYACLLRHPVYCPLDPAAAEREGEWGEAVNAEPPPWRDPNEHSELRRRTLALAFAARFETRFEPLCTIPVAPDPNPDSQPDQHEQPLRGLLWVQDAARYGSSDNRQVWAFVRGMMISDDARELLPRWAGFVGAALESHRLTPTASREDLQRDASYDQAQAQVREALIFGLAALARDEPATWRRILARHNEALLGAAIADDRLFELVAEQATLPTSQGDLTLDRILARSQGRIYVSQAPRGGFEELLFRALAVPVVQGVRYAAQSVAQRWCERRGVPLVVLGTEAGERALFRRVAAEELPPGRAAALRAAFVPAGEQAGAVEVVLSRFSPAHLPFVLVPDREVELKRRIEADEADRHISTAALGLARMFTAELDDGPPLRLHLNLDCPAIAGLAARLPEAATASPEPSVARALNLLRPLVALLSQLDEQHRYMSSEAALQQICALVEELLSPRALP